jgi:hypothetical protein
MEAGQCNNGPMVSAAPPGSLTAGRRIRLTLVVWLAMLGLDFLLNGGLFARMYQGERAFMLAPSEAFRRIPLGYLAFLILAVGVVELVHRLRVTRLADGLRLGLLIGAVLAATWGLGLYLIASLSAQVALAFASCPAVGATRPEPRGLPAHDQVLEQIAAFGEQVIAPYRANVVGGAAANPRGERRGD